MTSPSNRYYRSKTHRLVLIALLTALAIALMAVERLIPVMVAVPGVKLGLANVVTLTALYVFSWRDTLAIILLRVLLGSLILGSFSAFLFSLGEPSWPSRSWPCWWWCCHRPSAPWGSALPGP